MCLVIEDHLVVDDVGEPPFEGAHRFHPCFPGGEFAIVVGAAFRWGYGAPGRLAAKPFVD